MADDLGMLHDALHWWQSCRDIAPGEVTPVVEIASILADMGEYSLAQERLQSILDDNMDVGMTQFRKINSLLQLFGQLPRNNRKTSSSPTNVTTTAGKPFARRWSSHRCRRISSSSSQPCLSCSFS